MIFGKIASAALGQVASKVPQLNFLLGDPSMLVQALLAPAPPKAPDPRDETAIRQYEVDLANWYAKYGVDVTQLVPVVREATRRGRESEYGVLPGRHVSGRLFRGGGEDIRSGASNSFASVLSPGGRNVPP